MRCPRCGAPSAVRTRPLACGHSICVHCHLSIRFRRQSFQCPECHRKVLLDSSSPAELWRRRFPPSSLLLASPGPSATAFVKRTATAERMPPGISNSRSKIFPNAKKTKAATKGWTGQNSEADEEKQSAQRQTLIRIRQVPASHGTSAAGTNGNEVCVERTNKENSAQFRKLCDRFVRAIALLEDGVERSKELFWMAKEELWRNEQRISKNIGTGWTARMEPGQREHAELTKKLHKMVDLLEEHNQGGESAPLVAKVKMAQLHLLALSVVLEQNQQEKRDFERRISLVGSTLKRESWGWGEGEDAEQVLSTLLRCSEHINFLTKSHTSLLAEIAQLQFHLFDAMDGISKSLESGTTKNSKRASVWRNAQCHFGEILKLDGLIWTGEHLERIELVGHLAKLLSQYADICDIPTQTLCMFEMAKFRVAVSKCAVNSTKERHIEEQFSQIDSNLLECQRLQKLIELRSSTQTLIWRIHPVNDVLIRKKEKHWLPRPGLNDYLRFGSKKR